MFIDVSVYSVLIEKSERLCTRVLGVSMSPCFYDFSISLGDVPTLCFVFISSYLYY
jgi:hypothetical protein